MKISKASPSTPIRSITVGSLVSIPNNTGDTWALAWTREGELYSPANDTNGFHATTTRGVNVCFNQILGDNPRKLDGKTVNMMSDYRYHLEESPDRLNWKTSGCTSVDGALYLVVSRHDYGENSGDRTRRQPAKNTSIIRSANGGKTWVRAAQDNYDQPMFRGSRFATPYFINYGQDGHEVAIHGSDRYIYALSNNGFWDNGDDMVLGRVLRSKLARLQGDDWNFFCGGDGARNTSWSAKMRDAAPVLTNIGRLGSTGATYLPKQKCYLMIGWYYPLGGGKMPGAHSETCWDFYTSPFPWGPWKNIGSHRFNPQGYYCPTICPKFTSADGSTIWASTAGDWTNPDVYRLTMVPLKLRVS
jgi:hypothetical protein